MERAVLAYHSCPLGWAKSEVKSAILLGPVPIPPCSFQILENPNVVITVEIDNGLLGELLAFVV